MSTINKVRKIEKNRIKKLIYAEYEKNGMISACDWASDFNKNHIAQIPFEWCEPCDNHMPSIDHECACCGQATKKPTKPKFYQAVLKPVKDIMAHVYPQGGITLEERMPNNASCSECGENKWWLLPSEGVAVAQGGKAYCECLNCGHTTHL
jgi:DNA-directed RNA polymerase subunit M/transcription elongation factor TFIIS